MQPNHQRVVYYAARKDNLTVVKIGTTVHLPKRLAKLRKRYGADLVILGVEFDHGPTNVFTLEGERHSQFRDCNIIGEWFWVTPALHKHIYNLDVADLEDVMS